MTREEAIRILDPGFVANEFAKYDEEHGIREGEHLKAIYDACVLAVEALREQEDRRWIPVAESPKGKGCYIVAVNHWLDGKPVTREAYWNGCDWLSCDKKRELTPRVTHWMPLPKPPKGE